MAIKILDSIEPAGKFSVADAEDISYSTRSVAEALTDLQESVNDITRILNSIPTFSITGIPTATVTPNEEIKVNIFVKSENAAECRILIRKQKVGSKQIRTTSATCYPGQEYPITLDTPKELGVFKYTISVTNGTSRCGVEGTTDGAETDIQYEYEFEIVCGTATLLLPVFERSNAGAIYSFNYDNNIELDFNYTVAEPLKSYEFKIKLLKNGTELIAVTKEYEEENVVIPGTALKKQVVFPFKVDNTGATDIYEIEITATAFDEQKNKITTSVVSHSYVIDLMVENSITHTLAAVKPDLTSNDYLSIQFIPKTNNTNYNRSVIKYVCELYRKNGSVVDDTPVKTLQINAYNLQTSTVSFDKFIALDTTLAGINTGATQKYQLRLQCTDLAITNRQLTNIELTICKVPDLSSEYVKDGLVLSFDFSKNIIDGKATEIENDYTDNLPNNTSYSLNLINTTAEGAREYGEIITSDTRLAGVNEPATYFTFRGGQGAVLVNQDGVPVTPSKTFYTNTALNPNFIPGYSFEILFKSTFLGDYSAVTASFGNDHTDVEATDGVSLPIGKCRTYNKGEVTEASVRHGVWKHVLFVVEKEPAIKYKIYVNGILTAVKAFNDEDSPAESTPLTLNGIWALNPDTNQTVLQKSGTSSIKFIRYYSRALTDADVFQNFKTIYTKEEYKNVIDARNSSISSINVFFIKNSPEIRNRPENKVKGYISFADLNTIEKKKPEDDNDTDYTSKTHAVNGTMLYTYVNSEGKFTVDKFSNVDILLQGTSSLKYPVKNYQIKVYSHKHEEQYGQVADGKDSIKAEIYPPAQTSATWPTPSYIYTLKCDYMEESHRNNTPTACYYQDYVLDTVIDYCQTTEYYRTHICGDASNTIAAATNANDVLFKDSTGEYNSYSPARRHLEPGDVPVRPYRDSIDGVPCIVYFSDTPLTKEISTEDDVKALATSATCVGSYMFNIDKEGPQLGFELPAEDLQGSTSSSRNAYLDDGKVKVDGNGHISSTGELLLESLPCVSYEGATNDNFSAAAFMPYAVQRANYLRYAWDTAPETSLTVHGVSKVYKYFNLRAVKTNDKGFYIYETNDEGATKPDSDWVVYFDRETGFGNETDLNTREVDTDITPEDDGDFEGQWAYYTAANLDSSSAWQYNGTAWEKKTDLLTLVNNDSHNQRVSNISFLSYITSFYHDKLPDGENTLNAGTTRALHGCNTVAEHSEIYGENEIDYINKTLEPRFTFADDVDEEVLEALGYNADDLSFTTIKSAISWAYECFKMLEGDEASQAAGKAKFRNEFTQYFSFEYCLTYFLQMMLFTQVDNAGKNAMFDTWGNGKLYPRPYDMDTQMGLNNSGTDRIPVSAELNPVFSPQRGGTAVRNSMWATSSDTNHIRFLSYNTTNSALWKTFALSFADEIKACYSHLRRSSIYDAETIQNYINSKTRDVIGETYYNKDAINKYMYDANDTSFYYCVNGSREDRYFEFLNNRITFLDSYYNFTMTNAPSSGQGAQANNQIMLRALPLEIGDYIILKPLSPMYVSVTAEPNTTTCLITPEDTYEDEAGEIQIGSKFTFQMEAPDKNMYITGSDNLSDIAGLDTLTISEIQLKNAKNITDLIITDAPALQSLTLIGNSNLKTLDLSNNPALKIQLDLRDCVNLKSVNISNSGITSLALPENCDLTYLNCTNCSGLKSISLKNMLNLTNENLILTGCKGITTLEIENCPQIISTDEKPFIKDVANQQDKDKTLPALQLLTVKNCPNFKTLTMLQRNLNRLEFDFVEQGLTTLNLKGCFGNAFYLLELHNCPDLKTVNLNGVYSSGLSTDTNKVRLRANHKYTSVNLGFSQINVIFTNTETENTMDFDSIEFDSLTLNNNKSVTAIMNLNYTGNLSSLLNKCKVLESFHATNLKSTDNTNINYLFSECENLADVTGTLDFSNATTAIGTCSYCYKLSQESLETILGAFGTAPKVTTMNSFAYDALSSNCAELKVALPATVTSLSHAFSATNIERVSSELLNNCTSLTTVTAMFSSCSKLKFVHRDLFKTCTSLAIVRECFRSCSSLGMSIDTTSMTDSDKAKYAQDNNIMYSSLDIFPEANNITDISYLFHSCPELVNKTGIGDGHNRTTETSADDDIYANKFLTKLTKLQKAICTFHGTKKLRLYFKDAIFNFNDTQESLEFIDGMFAYSGLLNIPSLLSKKSLPSLINARGVFSNILPEGEGEGESGAERYTRIAANFFENTTKIQYISDSISVAGNSTFQNSSGIIPNFGGIFANVPNLLLEVGCFSKLDNLKEANRAIFTGSIADADSGVYSKYNTRSTVNPNKHPASLSGTVGSLISYYPKVVEIGTMTEVLTDVDLFKADLTTLTKAAYLFAGNPTIQSVSSNFVDILANATDLSGLFSNCMELTCETKGGNNLISITSYKSKLTNASLMFENCYKLVAPITNGSITVLTGTATDSSVTSFNCRGMFYGSGITGRVPANLFESCRDKVTNTSYMFSKCHSLSGIDMGYATDYNIPYIYDGSDVEYYYERNKTTLTAYPTYSSFKSAMNSYFTDTVRDNWFGSGKQFDRYRNYLEQWFYTQSRYYPTGLTYADFTTAVNKIITIGTRAEIEDLGPGRYYVTEADNVGLWHKEEDGTVERITDSNSSKCVYLLDELNNFIYITSIADSAESGESVIISQLADGGYRPVGTQETVLLSRYGYYDANNKYTIRQKGLLSDCTRLNNVAYMFAGCYGLTGCIPADMFAYTNTYKNLTSLEGLFAACSNLTLNATPAFKDEQIGMILSCSEAVSYESTVYDSLSDGGFLKSLGGGGYYSKVYPTVVYTKDGDDYICTVVDGETEDLENYFVPKDWLSKLTAVSNIKNIFNTVGIACDFRVDTAGRITSPPPGALGRPSKTDTSGFGSDSYIYAYLKLDNSTFNNTTAITNANSAFKNVYTLGATEIGRDFLYTSRSSLKDISYIFYTSTLRQVNKPFQSTTNLTNVKDCFYGLNTNYNLLINGYDGPRDDKLYKESDDGKPISWMTSHTYGTLKESVGPELWKFTKIIASDRDNCLASLTKESGRESWFDYRTDTPGYSSLYNPTLITNPDSFRQ